MDGLRATRRIKAARSAKVIKLPRPWLLLALALGLTSPASAQAPGTWAPIEDLNQPRAEHTATLLANGTVLIAGGRDAADQALASAEIYDPATGGYTLLASPLPAPIWGHTATRLDDGTVLIAGGRRGASPRRAAQLFDPATDTFTALGPMSTPRGRHTATLLRDGRVVVIGGTDGVGPLASLELYDPTRRTFSRAPSALTVARQDHTATLLPDGRVLVAGGSNASGALDSAELYDPTAGTVSPAGPLNVPRTLASAALLLDGTVLVAGGQTTTSEDLDSAEVYDPATKTFARRADGDGPERSSRGAAPPQRQGADFRRDEWRAARGECRGLRPGHERVPARRLARHRAAALRRQLFRAALYGHPPGHRRPRQCGGPARVLGGLLLPHAAQRQERLRARRDRHADGRGVAAERAGRHQYPRVERRSRHEPDCDGGHLWGLHQQRISDQSRPFRCRRPVPRHRDRAVVPVDGADDFQ